MSSEKKPDCGRRNLVFATAAVGGVATVATAVPFLASMAPSERAKAAGAPVEADISKLAPGEMMRVEWRGKPVWIIHRTKEMLEALGKIADRVSDAVSKRPMQPEYARNEARSIKPEYLIVVGICTHLGCSPTSVPAGSANPSVGADWQGGFFCPCHGSTFDGAGRVFRNKPAPTNLEVPPHRYVSETRIVIGDDRAA